DRNRSHWSTSKTPSYTKSVSWQHHLSLRSNAVGSTDGCLPQAKTVSFENKIKVNVNPSVFLT
ncbi:hypothetical protein, partial [Enterobacter hormaechei]|uniref:hypothetical protein n=1 Tax=Enterobacter hormaechei TaxID=158836 RepID=UPI0029D53F27